MLSAKECHGFNRISSVTLTRTAVIYTVGFIMIKEDFFMTFLKIRYEIKVQFRFLNVCTFLDRMLFFIETLNIRCNLMGLYIFKFLAPPLKFKFGQMDKDLIITKSLLLFYRNVFFSIFLYPLKI